MKQFLKYSLFLLIIFIGCKESDEKIDENEICCNPFDVNTMLYLSIQSISGEDLLDSATSGHFYTDSIQIFYPVDGELVSAVNWYNSYNGPVNVNNKYGTVYYYNYAQKDFLLFVLNWDKQNRDYSEEMTDSTWTDLEGNSFMITKYITNSYIKYNHNVMDTIKAEILSDNTKYYSNKIWYNGQFFDMTEPYITIVK